MTDPAPLLPIAASGLSIGGRERQEDALALAMTEGRDLGFAILSDGMGGHAAGDLASHLIVSEIFSELTVRCRSLTPETADIPALLRHAIAVANDALRAHVLSRPTERGMGGTLVTALLWRGHLYWASVGDSLLYLLRDGQLRRLNADHSMAPQLDLMVAKGLMAEEDARTHAQRSCLTSAIMGDDISEIDCPETPLDMQSGDVLLLASDGLLTLSEEALIATVAKTRAQGSRAITRALLSAVQAADAPDQDNTSLVVVDIVPAPAPHAAATARKSSGPWAMLTRLFGGGQTAQGSYPT